jgi:hypothetical protein
MSRRRGGAFTVDDFLQSTQSNTRSGHNKALRKELLSYRIKRDIFLRRRLSLIKPFLPDKDYFTRRDREEQEKNALRHMKLILGNTSVSLADISMEELDEVQPMPCDIVDITADTLTGDDNDDGDGTSSNAIIDESTLLMSSLREVETIEMPSILTASLHDHQVSVRCIIHTVADTECYGC